jgi:hypothetical protein
MASAAKLTALNWIAGKCRSPHLFGKGTNHRTQAHRRLAPPGLAFIAEAGETGRTELQITSCGGRSASQIAALRQAGSAECVPVPFASTAPDRICITNSGRKALAGDAKEPPTYRCDGHRYIAVSRR